LIRVVRILLRYRVVRIHLRYSERRGGDSAMGGARDAPQHGKGTQHTTHKTHKRAQSTRNREGPRITALCKLTRANGPMWAVRVTTLVTEEESKERAR